MEKKNSKEEYVWHYDAFISYRHLDPDEFAAARLHKKLESFRLMPDVAKKHPELPKRIKRVFRDQEELPLAPNLADPITMALKNSDNLIVICTPRLKESRWCLHEIENFIAFHGREHVYTALVEGEPADSFPEILLHDENGNPVEPLAADFRGATHKEIAKKIDSEVLRLIAPMYGLNYDELKQRHKEQRMRRILALGGTLLALTTCLGIYFGVTAYRINKQAQQIAEQNAQITEQNSQITEQYNQILVMDEEINRQYKNSLKKYETSVAGTTETMMKDGRRNDAIAVLTEVMPATKMDDSIPYSGSAEYALGRICNVYGDESILTPTTNYEGFSSYIEMYLSPDGDKLAALDNDYTINIWKVDTGEKIGEVKLSYASEKMFTFISDNEMLLVDKYKVDILNLDTMERNTIFEEDLYPRLIWNTDKKIIVIDSSKVISVFDIQSKSMVSRFEKEEERKTELFSDAILRSGDDVYIELAKCSGSNIVLTAYDLTSGKVISALQLGQEAYIHGMCTNGNEIYLSGYVRKNVIEFDKFFMKYDYMSGNKIYQVPSTEIGLKNLTYTETADAGYVLGNSGDVLYIQNAENGEVLNIVSFDNNIVRCIPTKSGGYVALILDNGTIEFLSAKTIIGKIYDTYNYDISGKISNVVIHDSGVYFSKKDDSVITKYEYTYEQNMDEIYDHADYSYFLEDGKSYLKVDYTDKKHVISNVEDQTEKYTIEDENYNVKLVNSGAEGLLFYSSSVLASNYKVYNSSNGEVLVSGEGVRDAFPNSYGNALLGKKDGLYYGVDVFTGNELGIELAETYADSNYCVDFAGDFTKAASISGRTLYLFGQGSTEPEKQVTISGGKVSHLFYSNDSKYLCITYQEKMMAIYDANSLELKTIIYDQVADLITMRYIPGYDNYILQEKYKNAIMVNSDLEVIARLNNCVGYSEADHKLTFASDYSVTRCNLLTYEEIMEKAKAFIGDYEAPKWIYQKYGISAEE